VRCVTRTAGCARRALEFAARLLAPLVATYAAVLAHAAHALAGAPGGCLPRTALLAHVRAALWEGRAPGCTPAACQGAPEHAPGQPAHALLQGCGGSGAGCGCVPPGAPADAPDAPCGAPGERAWPLPTVPSAPVTDNALRAFCAMGVLAVQAGPAGLAAQAASASAESEPAGSQGTPPGSESGAPGDGDSGVQVTVHISAVQASAACGHADRGSCACAARRAAHTACPARSAAPPPALSGADESASKAAAGLAVCTEPKAGVAARPAAGPAAPVPELMCLAPGWGTAQAAQVCARLMSFAWL
jgi:hypothetical protein